MLSISELSAEIAARRISIHSSHWMNDGLRQECWVAVAVVPAKNVLGDLGPESMSSAALTPEAAVSRVVRKIREWESNP